MSALTLYGLFEALFVVALVLLSLPIAVFVLEIALSLVGGRGRSASAATVARGPLAVLVPAHNEGAGILATLASVKAQLQPGDRLPVNGGSQAIG